MSILAFTPPTAAAEDNEYYFDASLFKGSNFDQEALKKLSKPDAVLPGTYQLDVYVNQQFLGRYSINVKSDNGTDKPCFSPDLINAIGFKNYQHGPLSGGSCLFMSDVKPQASVHLSISGFRLDVTVPQSLLIKKPRGWIDPAEYDTGTNIGFANYLANYYHVSYSDSRIRNQDSAWLSLNGGINLGTWQYRQSGSATWNQQQGASWNTIRGYIQRPVLAIRSEFMAGQLITNGNFFSGLSYSGVNLASSQAMLPDTQQGYAPAIRGVASTNAKVSVRQNGNEIYQITVPPGAFEITDLTPTSSSGDLQVEVTEADGTVKKFVVPFSAVPESIRPGVSRYNLAIGKTRDMYKDADFGDIIYQRGLTNAFTGNGGLRFSEGYMSSVLGGVYASQLGAIGSDITWSRASLPEGDNLQGWMSRISWSKTFAAAGTTVSLASYRYSTTGYRDLSSILGMRYDALNTANWLQYASEQRERFDVTMSQNMNQAGNLFITAATQNYRNGRSRDTQYQIGYSKSFNGGISMSFAVNRQQTGNYGNNTSQETAISATLSIPLFPESSRSASLSNTFSHSNSGGSQYQTSLSGSMDEQQTTSYSVSATHDAQLSQDTLSSSLQKRLPKVSLGMNGSVGKNYWQLSGNAQGAAALHSGGLTLGPYLGDTFGLIEAKGAEGAELFNAPQTRIDDNGYALVPSMTPYRYNTVSLDPAGMDGNAEILDSQKRVVPVSGAVSRVTFRTKTGTALLITVHSSQGESIPMGAPVVDENGVSAGIAGQGSQIYVRAEKEKGYFVVSWGDNNQCRIPYSLTADERRMALVTLTASCEK
ncbi:fimbria/pilus outer membrane usher protein [Pantoea sp. NSTU24]|uniref:fimbria/pilus outer membrane usher protein n=1 Tax=Pantoea sp. NSTU24 TaxID=3391144 RepID=UPI003D046402